LADELRMAFHDRISELRARSIDIVRLAADALGNVTRALLSNDATSAAAIVAGLVSVQDEVREVDAGVTDVLALQAPVARDLRMILTTLRVAQIGELCIGLIRSLASRVGRGEDVLTPGLRAQLGEIGAHTASLLAEANQAWIGIDPEVAAVVERDAETNRAMQRHFLAGLLELQPVPIETGVDLGMLARAYERLTDHAVEIAGRVQWTASSPTPSSTSTTP
jgi:phosphate transport system protein